MLLQRTHYAILRLIRSLYAGPLPNNAKTRCLCALVLLLCAAGSLLADVPAAQYIRLHPPRGDIRRLIMMGEVFGFGLSAALIILTAAVLDVRRRRLVLRLIPYTYGAGLCANILKVFIARSRPLTLDLQGSAASTFVGWLPASDQGWGYAFQSFPSGHTATAVGLAIGLTSLYPQGRWLFTGFAALTALQRIVSGAHFISDTFAGAAMAFLFAGALAAFFANRQTNSLN